MIIVTTIKKSHLPNTKMFLIQSGQCDEKKSPNFNKSCLKMISLEKLKISTPLQKFPKNVGDLGK